GDPRPGGDEVSLSASGYKSKGTAYVDLSWSGAATSTVDVYRNGTLVGSVANTNSYTDTITTKGGGSYTYQVCEAQSTTVCSNNSTVVF
ncbi:MAG: chitinase N-terminal domain-containing protein, partial [Pseudomonadota bacterium]|nr:chitinase N-terminal domain-containing protein [Pseudomonadota bacterium]